MRIIMSRVGNDQAALSENQKKQEIKRTQTTTKE